MADDLERPGGDAEPEAPPHAAPPSIWPFAFALGIAFALIGLVISWPIAAIWGAIEGILYLVMRKGYWSVDSKHRPLQW